MPKSKRSKVVSLTKTEKNVGARKHKLVEEIRKSLEEYGSIYVFNFHNMRTTHFKDVRTRWGGSRFFLGKNKVMQVALGRSEQDEPAQDLHKLSRLLVGNSGLFFTNSPKEEVIEYFDSFKEKDYARAGFVATETVEMPAGPLEGFAHSLEPWLRKLGMPVRLNKGVIHLDKAYTVCTKGSPLNPEQAKVLKLLDIKMAEFGLQLLSVWTKSGEAGEGTIEQLGSPQ